MSATVCPLMSLPNNTDTYYQECIKEKCAWWIAKDNITQADLDSKNMGSCAIKIIAEKEVS